MNGPSPYFGYQRYNIIRNGDIVSEMLLKRFRSLQKNNKIEWIHSNRIIDLTKNDECPINLNKFVENCVYCICSTCKHNFDANALKESFRISRNNRCPLCRSEWTEFIEYVNK